MGGYILGLMGSSVMIGLILGGLLHAIFSEQPLIDDGLYWIIWIGSLPLFGGVWGMAAFGIWEEVMYQARNRRK